MEKDLDTYTHRALILEDNPTRYPYLINLMFQIAYPVLEKLVIVTTAKAAKEELGRYKEWDFIMLDHDLDGQVYCKNENENENTGYQVAKFIKENKIKFKVCIIHTLNEYAVPKMMKELEGVEGQVVYKPCVDL